MSLLTVVRHGQASFLAENYDRLSPLGEEQARLLGRYWVAAGTTFDRIFTGPAERQIRTAAIAGEELRAAGRQWPEPECLPDLDEFPAEPVVRAFLPGLMEQHEHLRQWVDQLQNGADRAVKQRAFDSILRDVSQRWLRGEVGSAEIPSWQDFCHRVESAIAAITEGAPKSTRAAVFTSAGPMAATARVALRLSYEATLELTWSPRNASVSDFLFTPGRFSLSCFNTTPHLAEPRLITYR
ncbi:MAG: histidine phosphatase family protein [Bryobacteraceae bacterium]